jgi:hypothetical protein
VQPQVFAKAIRAYEGDVPTLQRARAELVGTVDASGNGFASRDFVENTAATAAAAHGGTHYLVLGRSAQSETVQLTPDSSTTRFAGDRGHTTYTSGTTIDVTKFRNTILVVRVPWDQFKALPRQLWPVRGVNYGDE